MKASQNRFQSNETTESTFNAPTMAKSGITIPSILQSTRPQDRPFRKQPTPAQATAITQTTPLPVRESIEAPYAHDENSRHVQQQVAPRSPLEVSTPRWL